MLSKIFSEKKNQTHNKHLPKIPSRWNRLSSFSALGVSTTAMGSNVGPTATQVSSPKFEEPRWTQLVGGFNQPKNISQNGNLPQVGVKIKNIWNHQLVKHWSLGVSSIPRWLPTGFFAERPSGSRVYSVLVVFVTFQGTNTYPTQREKENHLQIYTLGWGYVSSLLYVFVTIFFRGGVS